MSPTVPLVRQLLLSPSVSLWSVRRTTAYTTRYRFLSTVTLGEGGVDLATNMPDRDITLLAATATLVVREDVHPVIVRLLLKTAEVVHSRPGLFEAPNTFPSDAFVELPLHEVARRYLRKGPPLLERYLPFWIAVTAERWALLRAAARRHPAAAHPLRAHALQLADAQRVTRWYRVVHDIEHSLAQRDTGRGAGGRRAAPRRAGGESWRMKPPPPSFMGELYHLKQHLEWLLDRAERQAEGAPGQRTTLTPASRGWPRIASA